MAGPTYSTDLTTLDEAGAGTTYSELSSWTNLFAQTSNETDAYIQGSNCVSWTVKTGLGGCYPPGVSAQTFPTDGAVLIWAYWSAPNSLEPIANGGIRTVVGSSGSAFDAYYQGGSDTYTYGGWINLATGDPASITRDANVGTTSTSYTVFGWAYNAPTSVPSKGNPYYVDAIRIGRCQLLCVNGDGTEPAAFTNAAANNDAQNNRWGLLQAISGGYLQKGLFSFGNTTNYVHFVDSNKSITIDNTRKVTSNFNRFEVSNNSSNVFLTAVSISSTSSVSRGNFVVNTTSASTANVILDTCTFTDMGYFILQPGTKSLGSTYRRCLSVNASSSNCQSSVFASYQGASNTSALVWTDNTDTNGKLDGCTFTHGSVANNCHGLELSNTSLTSITLTGVTFSGYNSANGNPNSAIHVMKSAGALTINVTGGTTPSILTEGADVTVVSGSVDVTVDAKTVGGTAISGARVILKASDGTGPFPFEESVTIVNTGTSANVHHIGHGMATNDKVLIDGSSHWENNGVFEITKIDDNYYNYTLPSDPGSSPTGTITATFVALEGTTDGTGTVTTSRVYSSGQNVTGWVRKSTSPGPYYVTSPLTGQVNNATGYSATAVMISDE